MTQDLPDEPTVDELLAYVYSLEENKRHREAARIVMLHIEHCLSIEWHAQPNRNISKLGFPFISDLMEKIDLSKVGSNCMIGIIRSTYRVRQVFLNWEPLLKKIKAEMIRRNMDYKALLIGLM